MCSCSVKHELQANACQTHEGVTRQEERSSASIWKQEDGKKQRQPASK